MQNAFVKNDRMEKKDYLIDNLPGEKKGGLKRKERK